MSLSTFLSSFLPTASCDAAPEKEENEQVTSSENDGESKEEEPEAEEEEEDEPEDVMPAIREECSNSGKCAQFTKHFDHCQEKVEAGEGFKGEDCVEEMCKFIYPSSVALANFLGRPVLLLFEVHMMHCVDVRFLQLRRDNLNFDRVATGLQRTKIVRKTSLAKCPLLFKDTYVLTSLVKHLEFRCFILRAVCLIHVDDYEPNRVKYQDTTKHSH